MLRLLLSDGRYCVPLFHETELCILYPEPVTSVLLLANVALITFVWESASANPVPPSAKSIFASSMSPVLPFVICRPLPLFPRKESCFIVIFPPELLACIPVPLLAFLFMNVMPSMFTGLLAVVARFINIPVELALFSCVVIMVGWLKSCKPDSL